MLLSTLSGVFLNDIILVPLPISLFIYIFNGETPLSNFTFAGVLPSCEVVMIFGLAFL